LHLALSPLPYSLNPKTRFIPPNQFHVFIFSVLGSLLLWQMAEAIEAYYTAPTTGLGKQALLATGWGYLAAGDLVCAREDLE